uniref:PHD-type domain-containing protein n=1 Tax=Oryza barthii TaxID=65489 RepID=A0A0D3HKP6_9ORYZ
MAAGGSKSVVAALAVAFFLLAAFASGLSTGDATSVRGTSGGGGSGAAQLRQAPPTLAPRPLVGDAMSGRRTGDGGGNSVARLRQAPSGRFGGGDDVFSPPTVTRAMVAEMELYDLTGGCVERGLHGDGEPPGPRRGKALGENLRGEEERLVSNAQENNVTYVDSSSEESEDQQVKICDICGDVGEEKKLAICSRCNDGAEHIYCMRVMMPEVPEGDWFCEECRTEMQIEKEKSILEKSQVKVSTISVGSKVKAANVSNKDLNVSNTSSKSTKEDAEEGIVPSGCTSTGKEEDGRSCIGGSEAANKNEEQTSSGRNDDFNLKIDGERHMQSHNNDVPFTSVAHDISNMAVKNKSSIKSEVKSSEEVEDVKVCDICGDIGAEEKLAVCSRCNDGAEHIYCMRVMMQEVPKAKWLCETCHSEVESEKRKNKIETSELKVGGSKGPMNKPSSSENGVDAENVGSNMSNRGNEMNSVNKRKDGDAGITSLVRQNPVSRESSFKLDGKKGKDPAGHVSTLLTSNYPKNQMAPLRGQLSKSTSFNNSKVPKVKQLLNEVPQKPKTFKDSLSTPMRKEGPMGILAKSASFKKPKCFEPVNKAKPSTVMNPLVSENARNDILTSILGSRSLTGSVIVPVHSKAQSSAQHLNKGNRMADSNILGTSGGEGHCGIKKPPHTKGHANIGMLGLGAQKKTIQVPDSSHLDDQIKSPSSLVPSNSSSVSIPGSASLRDHQAVPSMRGRSVDSISAMSKDMKEKKKTGGFELSRTVRSTVLCEGLQAHLSCFASPKVLEVAKKFPSNVQLEELPRQNLWPPQFHDNGPTIDSIALFFFARDTESYEIHYRKLVENMLKDDLALRGNIETAELLIFASNTLPNNFQHDNNQGCSNGVKSLFHPLVGNPLDGQSHDSITAMFPTNSSAIDDFLPVLTRKDLKLAYSEQKEKMGYPSEGNGCDVNFDVNMKLNTCSFSVIHGKGNESTNNKMDNAEHLMDGDSVNATGVSSSNVHTISHVSGGVRKRSVDVANWDDKVSCAHAFMARKELSKMQQCLRSVGKMSRTKPS